MFFDEIKMSKKSWHYRLQSWMFGMPPFEDNFCPYFWLTIFCLFISPFIAAVRFFPAMVIYIGEFFGWLLTPFNILIDVIEQHICKPMVENRIRSLSDAEVYFVSNYVYDRVLPRSSHYRGESTKTYEKCYAQFSKWKALTGENWAEELEKIKQRVEAQFEETEKLKREYAERQRELKHKEDIKRAERRKKFAKVVKYTKWVILPLVGLMGVASIASILYAIALGLIWLVKFIVSVWNWKAALCISAILGMLVGGTLFVLLVITSIKKLGSCLQVMVSNIPSKPKRTEPSQMGRFFKFIGNAVVSPFQIFIDYVKVFKQNNCPAIKWDENEFEKE